jgi:hypothetical protein
MPDEQPVISTDFLAIACKPLLYIRVVWMLPHPGGRRARPDLPGKALLALNLNGKYLNGLGALLSIVEL